MHPAVPRPEPGAVRPAVGFSEAASPAPEGVAAGSGPQGTSGADGPAGRPSPVRSAPETAPDFVPPLPRAAPQADRHAAVPFGGADVSGRRAPHGDGAARRIGRTVRRVVGAAGDGRAPEGVAARLGAPVPSCRRIAVTSIRGGAGKSTVAALVAEIVRRHRDDRVVAIDADPGLGSLPVRLGVEGRGSVRHLAAARPGSWRELATHLARTPGGLFVVPTSHGSVADELEHETFQRGAGRLGEFFSAAIVDCGGGLDTELHRGIIAGAHAQVFVAPATVDGALSARAGLQWFGDNGFGRLLSRTVVVLVAHTPKPDADLERVRESLAPFGLPVAHVPFDRHLAAGGAMNPDRVGAAAFGAVTDIACDVFTRSLDAA
ncbi:hypothetical protein DMH08_34215 [Actinomadura sp. WAC 06369]|nr:hypothetical protein DMH08_34215 [Actinomadura sp. WAC 06369]